MNFVIRFFAAGLLMLPLVAQAQAPLRVLVGFPPGSVLDTMARLLADGLRVTLNQPVLVENRPGVSGQIAAEQTRNAAPDGNTIFITPLAPMVTLPHASSKMPYDPFRDFTYLAHVANIEFALAIPASLNAKTLPEYIELVRREPVKYANYSSAGAGAIPHFFGVLFGRTAKLETVHIPDNGTAQALPDLVSGQISGFVGTVGDVLPLHRSGKVRLLATSGKARHRMVPEVPTFREQGLDIEGYGWYGAYAPAGLAPAVAARLSAALLAAIKDPAVADKLNAFGLDITGLGATELAAIQKADYDKWGPIIKASGFRAD